MTLDLMQILVSLLLFSGVFLLVWSLFAYPVSDEVPVHRRMAAALGADRRNTAFENPALKPLMSLSLQLAKRLSVTSLRQMIRQNLDASGNPNGYSVDEYLALCVVMGAGLAVAAGVLAAAMLGYVDPLILLVMAALGFAGPIYTLRDAAQRRISRISKKLPYTMDLIALTMGSGSTFTEAIETIIMDEPEDDLNEELKLVQSEVNLGAKRPDALRHMAERIPLDSLNSVVGAINQAEQLGTPLSTILTIQARMMRMHRSVRAEKLAASASLRILFPSMIILIAVALVVFAPTILRWVQGDLFLG